MYETVCGCVKMFGRLAAQVAQMARIAFAQRSAFVAAGTIGAVVPFWTLSRDLKSSSGTSPCPSPGLLSFGPKIPQVSPDDEAFFAKLDTLMKKYGQQYQCELGMVCRWRYCSEDVDWSAAMFRAIELKNQRAVDTLAKNEHLHYERTFTAEHVAAAVLAGLDIKVLVNYGVPYTPAEIEEITNPVIKQGLVACARMGPSNKTIETMKFLLEQRDGRISRVLRCRDDRKFSALLGVATCLVPEVLEAIVNAVRSGEKWGMDLYGTLGPVLCDGGKEYKKFVDEEEQEKYWTRSESAIAHQRRMCGQPDEPMFSGGYFQKHISTSPLDEAILKSTKTFEQLKPLYSLAERLRLYALKIENGTVADGDRAILKDMLAESETAVLDAICAALEMDSLKTLKILVEEIRVPASRGVLVTACSLQRVEAVKYLLSHPSFDACL